MRGTKGICGDIKEIILSFPPGSRRHAVWYLMRSQCFVIVCSFVCLFAWPVFPCGDTLRSWWDQTQKIGLVFRPSYKSLILACWPSGLWNSKREKQIWSHEIRKRRPRTSLTNQVEQFYCQPLWQEKEGPLSNFNCHDMKAVVVI